jgi:hypothetical protein
VPRSLLHRQDKDCRFEAQRNEAISSVSNRSNALREPLSWRERPHPAARRSAAGR